MNPGIYLGIDPDQTLSYAECAENTPDETLDSGIILIEIELTENSVQVNPNNQCGTLSFTRELLKNSQKSLLKKNIMKTSMGNKRAPNFCD